MEKQEEWTAVRKGGKKVQFRCVQISPSSAEMTAKAEGEEERYRKKLGLNSALTHEEVEKEFSMLRGAA